MGATARQAGFPSNVKTISVQVRDDHLEYLARGKPLSALAELMWNALDADATEVRVGFEENALGGIDAVRVRDNGLGLPYDHALRVFRDLGGSWKSGLDRSPSRRRALHGKFGKGRFRAFSLGNRVVWQSTYEEDGRRLRYRIEGRGDTLGTFTLTDPEPAGDAIPGVTVEITDVARGVAALQGTFAVQEATDLFALYLSQYPGVRIVYDGVPLDPTTCEERRTEYDLGELVMQEGERARAVLTIVEWANPGKRGILLCDAHGFALEPARPRFGFRGFSYTAYLKSDHIAALDREGLLSVPELAPDVRTLVEAARGVLRDHFRRRAAERHRDQLALWRDAGVYPYRGDAESERETQERRLFDLYATHVNAHLGESVADLPRKRLVLRMVQELVRLDPIRLARVLSESASWSSEAESAVMELIEP